MENLPGVVQKRLSDGSMMAVVSNDQLIRALPVPIDFDAIEKEAAARFLANPNKAVTMVSDQTHQPFPLALFYFKGHKSEREDGWQFMWASAKGTFAAKEIRRAVKHFKKMGGL